VFNVRTARRLSRPCGAVLVHYSLQPIGLLLRSYGPVQPQDRPITPPSGPGGPPSQSAQAPCPRGVGAGCAHPAAMPATGARREPRPERRIGAPAALTVCSVAV